jgi:hypothetical protein
MFRTVVLFLGGLASLWAVPLTAQDAVLGEMYGRGVHSYFAGEYAHAFEQLTTAIQGGSKDPRVFYFRGLSYLKLGRPQEAKQDFKTGADLESRDINKFYNVSKALERVQGPGRIELEDQRVAARMTLMDKAEKLRKARYEAIKREESRVLRQQELTPPEPAKTAEPAAEPAAESTATDLFSAPDEKAGAKADKKSAKAAKKPAGEEPAVDNKAGAPGGENPFAAQTEKPAAAAPKKPAAKKGNVLGAMGKALGKAVAGDDAAAGEKKPVGEAKSDEAANPFGDEPAAKEKKPDAKKPAGKKAEAENPFAQ